MYLIEKLELIVKRHKHKRRRTIRLLICVTWFVLTYNEHSELFRCMYSPYLEQECICLVFLYIKFCSFMD